MGPPGPIVASGPRGSLPAVPSRPLLLSRTAPMARRRLLPGPDARQGLVALVLNSSTSLVAGAVLGSLTATFERRPGLLVLVPAAIGLRGNVFGSLGNRVSTSIHAGELQLRLRRSTVLGQNVLAASALTLGMSLVLVAARRRRLGRARASATRSASPTSPSCRSAAARSPRSPCWPPPSGWPPGRCASAGTSTT